ncbi:RNA polymerase sigma factor [Anaerovorax sp. IOR16]|uniref:RNA polymerase sigma factor n=1 Tax=Anaerovorax sp. IOR16 TaxID=2773458 RepID=UPI002ED342CD
MLVNASLDEIRKNKRILSTDPFEMPENIVQESITRDEIMDLYQALEGLNPDMKAIVILRYFEDMKLQEIASILDLNISTVKTRLYSALEKLKLQLKSEVFNDE